MNRGKIKKEILEKALEEVVFSGWNEDLLIQAAVKTGLDPSLGWRLFPKGPLDAIDFWQELVTQEMTILLPHSLEGRLRDRVALAMQTRFLILTPHREAARQTSLYFRFPPRTPQGISFLYKSVDTIWHYVGDQSTDFHFYTKRALLAFIYTSTFSYWLEDTSPHFENTWHFMKQRIETVLSFTGRIRGKA